MISKTIGILGGGQLGRMSALAAARLGIRVHIFTPEKDSPASQVSACTIIADYDDQEALKQFAGSVDVITYEFENIPAETIRFLKSLKPVYPDDRLLAVSQDRIAEKTYLNTLGIETARWARIDSTADIEKTTKLWKTNEIILKTTRFGYDGKGQIKHGSSANSETSWKALGARPLIAEEIVPFQHEISVIAARDLSGHTEIYSPVLNVHKNHILHKSAVPAPIRTETVNDAQAMIQKIAQDIDLIGVMALELFLTKDGRLLANEIAPRTHNSGHWSIEACAASQFENHVRAVCGLPLGSAALRHPAEMINLIGRDAEDIRLWLETPNAHLHLYGKTEIREGRKMGHVTILKD